MSKGGGYSVPQIPSQQQNDWMQAVNAEQRQISRMAAMQNHLGQMSALMGGMVGANGLQNSVQYQPPHVCLISRYYEPNLQTDYDSTATYVANLKRAQDEQAIAAKGNLANPRPDRHGPSVSTKRRSLRWKDETPDRKRIRQTLYGHSAWSFSNPFRPMIDWFIKWAWRTHRKHSMNSV